MKKKLILLLSIAFISGLYSFSKAQSTNDILNVLVANKSITAEQADSLRADAAIKQQDDLAKQKSYNVTASKKIQLAGYTHLRYVYYGDHLNNYNTFDVRRAYFDIKGNLNPYFAYRAQFDFASKQLIDGYADLNLKDYVNFRAGQQLIPFSLENVTSNTKLDLADRSQAVERLVSRGKDVIGNQNGRDIGVLAQGKLLKSSNGFFVNYYVGVFNGSGINQVDNNNSKDIIGRVVLAPIKGLTIGGSYLDGHGKFIKPGAAAGAKAETYDRSRWGTELTYDWSNLSIKGEYIAGKDYLADKEGYYAQLGYYIFPKLIQAVGRYDVFNADKSKSDKETTDYVIGLNYDVNNFTRLQAAYTIRKEQGKNLDNDYASIQLQLVF